MIDKENVDVFEVDSSAHLRGCQVRKLQLNFAFEEVAKPEDFLLHNSLTVSPWRYVIKKDFYINNKIEFEENCRIEDIDWACRLLCCANTIKYTKFLSVHYILDPLNTTSALYTNESILIDNINAINRAYQVYSLLPSNKPNTKKAIAKVIDWYSYNSIKYLLVINLSSKKKNVLLNELPIVGNKYLLTRIIKICVVKRILFSPVISFVLSNYRKIKHIR